MNSQNEQILNLINTRGIAEEHQGQLPLWAKYSKDSKTGQSRAFVIFSDGNLYNFNANSNEPADNNWNNWQKIKEEDLNKIKEVILELNTELENYKSQDKLNNTNILIQYNLDHFNKTTIISKDYNSTNGAFLKKINDLVNIGLANRNK